MTLSGDLQSFVLYIDYMEYAARGTMNSWLDCINWYFRCYTETIIFLGLKVCHANFSSKKKKSFLWAKTITKNKIPCQSRVPSPCLPLCREKTNASTSYSGVYSWSCSGVTSQPVTAQIKKILTLLSTSHILQAALLPCTRGDEKLAQYRCGWWRTKL